jgi:hypothetical protein
VPIRQTGLGALNVTHFAILKASRQTNPVRKGSYAIVMGGKESCSLIPGVRLKYNSRNGIVQ